MFWHEKTFDKLGRQEKGRINPNLQAKILRFTLLFLEENSMNESVMIAAWIEQIECINSNKHTRKTMCQRSKLRDFKRGLGLQGLFLRRKETCAVAGGPIHVITSLIPHAVLLQDRPTVCESQRSSFVWLSSR